MTISTARLVTRTAINAIKANNEGHCLQIDKKIRIWQIQSKLYHLSMCVNLHTFNLSIVSLIPFEKKFHNCKSINVLVHFNKFKFSFIFKTSLEQYICEILQVIKVKWQCSLLLTFFRLGGFWTFIFQCFLVFCFNTKKTHIDENLEPQLEVHLEKIPHVPWKEV